MKSWGWILFFAPISLFSQAIHENEGLFDSTLDDRASISLVKKGETHFESDFQDFNRLQNEITFNCEDLKVAYNVDEIIDDIEEMFSANSPELEGFIDGCEMSLDEMLKEATAENKLFDAQDKIVARPKVVHRNVQLSKEENLEQKDVVQGENTEQVLSEVKTESEDSQKISTSTNSDQNEKKETRRQRRRNNRRESHEHSQLKQEKQSSSSKNNDQENNKKTAFSDKFSKVSSHPGKRPTNW